jgi:hypothetical protein
VGGDLSAIFALAPADKPNALNVENGGLPTLIPKLVGQSQCFAGTLAKSKRATQGPRCLPLLWQVPKMFLDASDGGCVGAFPMLGGSVQLIVTIHRSCEITG